MPPRKKLELADCIERVVMMFNAEKKSCREITEQLDSEGIKVSHSTVARTVKIHNEAVEEQTKKMLEHRHLMQSLRDDINDSQDNDIDYVMLLNASLKAQLVQKMNEDEKSLKDLEKMAYMIESVSNTQVKLEKLKIEQGASVVTAKKAIEQGFIDLLKERDPEMLLKVIGIIKEIRLNPQKQQAKIKVK